MNEEAWERLVEIWLDKADAFLAPIDMPPLLKEVIEKKGLYTYKVGNRHIISKTRHWQRLSAPSFFLNELIVEDLI